MTALQELASVKGELDRIKAESDLNATSATTAANALAAVTLERDALAASNSALVSERDALAAKVASLEKASTDFAVSVETRAATIAVTQLASVGVAPVAAAPTAPVADFATQLMAEKDPVKRTAFFREHRKAIAAQHDSSRRNFSKN